MDEEKKFLTTQEVKEVVDRIEFSEDVAYLHDEVVAATCPVCGGDYQAVTIEEMDEIDDNHPHGEYWMLVHYPGASDEQGYSRACAGSGQYPKDVFIDDRPFDNLDLEDIPYQQDFEGGSKSFSNLKPDDFAEII